MCTTSRRQARVSESVGLAVGRGMEVVVVCVREVVEKVVCVWLGLGRVQRSCAPPWECSGPGHHTYLHTPVVPVALRCSGHAALVVTAI